MSLYLVIFIDVMASSLVFFFLMEFVSEGTSGFLILLSPLGLFSFSSFVLANFNIIVFVLFYYILSY